MTSGAGVSEKFDRDSAQACIRALRRLEQTAIMLERWAPECFPEINEQGQKHFVRVMMEAAAEEIRKSWADAVGDAVHSHHQEHRLSLDTDKQVFFYEQEFYVLSNFAAFSLVWKGERFETSEAAYHWEKFAHRNGQNHECDTCYVIRRADSAHAAFKIAEANKHTRRPDWDAVKVGIMRDILRAKVQQHGYVRQKLMQTGDRELIEHSWRDDFWGWGPNRDGQNMLGKLWMEIRAELRAEAE
jgi:ribA/ribD-fused uncharacterized protein